MIFGAIGSVIGAVGGLLSSRSNRRAAESAAEAAEFHPYSVTGPDGSTAYFDEYNRNVGLNLGADQQRLFQQLGSNAFGR